MTIDQAAIDHFVERERERLIRKLNELHEDDGGPFPAHCFNSFVAYIIEGAPMGSFLTYVLSNKFAEAVVHADQENLAHLRAYAVALYNYIPGRDIGAWGSIEKVEAWQKLGGLRGWAQQDAESNEQAKFERTHDVRAD